MMITIRYRNNLVLGANFGEAHLAKLRDSIVFCLKNTTAIEFLLNSERRILLFFEFIDLQFLSNYSYLRQLSISLILEAICG